MKKHIAILMVIIISVLLFCFISYAVGRIEITGLSTGCPTGFSLLVSGTKKFCEIKDPKIVDVNIESAKGRSRCPDGYVSDIYGDIHWCIKRAR